MDIAKHITKNKVTNQMNTLKCERNKSDALKEAVDNIASYIEKIDPIDDLYQLLSYEGLSSKLYFKNHFNNILWTGRQPRLKRDVVNSVLDIGYTLLFTFIDAILLSYGFDTYKGVMHTQFYMRKSLTCDIVEPFRVIIDKQIKKSINLKQIKDSDFLIINGQYRLKWEKSADYVKFLMMPLIENKEEIFRYIQNYYRAFMKSSNIEEYPVFNMEGGA